MPLCKLMSRTAIAIAFMLTSSIALASESAETAETRFTETAEVTYAYRSIGDASVSPPLILITRYRANMDDWDPAFINQLASERQVILFNQSGVSSTGGATPDTIGGMAEDVAQFVSSQGWDQVDILGWSMGGFTSQAMLSDHPELVRKAVLIGTGPAASDLTPGPKEGVFDVATRPSRADGTTTYSDKDREYLFFSDAPEHAHLVVASLSRIDSNRRPDEPVTKPDVMAAQTAAIQDFWFNPANGYFQSLSEIQQPVLIINGDNDAFFTVASQEVLFSQIPNAQLAILPGAGHGPQHQHPEYVAKLVNTFLD